ncbi:MULTISPECIES: Mu transposase C-terminal domain-containing protein [unclassified Cryobacterium]|uniref:Mu transposase C-terminal domain-containing protein n=1 Tax=unclassified Cryobacterium TaxID=2649013 RepID=UPI001F53F2C1|nr:MULTISPECIES: Mu transposase C-terminal domain-containing protein [unclassified Cryobacterium]
MPDTLEELDGLLLTVPKHRTVQRDGIHFQGQHYLAPTVASFVGRTITIRYDPRDLSEIRVFDHDTFVCVAMDEAHPNLRLSLRDIETAPVPDGESSAEPSTTASPPSLHVRLCAPPRQRHDGIGCAPTKRTNDERRFHRHEMTP